jgi:hypothetical protein
MERKKEQRRKKDCGKTKREREKKERQKKEDRQKNIMTERQRVDQRCPSFSASFYAHFIKRKIILKN